MYRMLLVAIIGSFSGVNSYSETRIVYGDDNRLDLKDIHNKKIKDLSKSIAGRIFKYSYTPDSNKKYMEIDQLLTLADPLGMNVCKEEKFSEQPTIVDCTGFLIGDDLLVTAGHCVVPMFEVVENDTTDDCMDYEWLFDFNIDTEKQTDPNKIDMNNLYGCEKVIYGIYEEENDFALIKLNRKVVGRTPLKLNTKRVAEVGSEIFVMGHPSGLPLKYADGAKIFSHHENHFSTNLDTFGGNSGSPVFNAQTLEVEGILVRGDVDYRTVFREDGSTCDLVNTCDPNRESCIVDDPDIDGEHVTPIKNVLELL